MLTQVINTKTNERVWIESDPESALITINAERNAPPAPLEREEYGKISRFGDVRMGDWRAELQNTSLWLAEINQQVRVIIKRPGRKPRTYWLRVEHWLEKVLEKGYFSIEFEDDFMIAYRFYLQDRYNPRVTSGGHNG